jgi:hypothetical protein
MEETPQITQTDKKKTIQWHCLNTKLVQNSTGWRFWARNIVCSIDRVKIIPVLYHAMKTYWGSGGTVPRILDVGTRWRWVVCFTPRPFYPQRKSPRYPLDRRLGGLQSRSGRGGEEKNWQPAPGIEPQNTDSPAHSQSLYRLSYHGLTGYVFTA